MSYLDDIKQTLILLRYEFDKALLEGKSFDDVKPLYKQIKQLERIVLLEPSFQMNS